MLPSYSHGIFKYPEKPRFLSKPVMRILKLAKYRLKAQVEKGEGPSGEG